MGSCCLAGAASSQSTASLHGQNKHHAPMTQVCIYSCGFNSKADDPLCTCKARRTTSLPARANCLPINSEASRLRNCRASMCSLVILCDTKIKCFGQDLTCACCAESRSQEYHGHAWMPTIRQALAGLSTLAMHIQGSFEILAKAKHSYHVKSRILHGQ